MKKRNLMFSAGVLGLAALAAFATRSSWMAGGVSAQGPQRARVVSVEVAKAQRKPVPVEVDSIGTVTPISSVALKSRLETTINKVHFEDGARVNEGDVLFTLDARQIDAQIEQAEGMIARDQASLEGAQRDVRRFSDLIGKGATTQVSLDNAKTQADVLIGTIKADQAALDNLKVQKSYTTIRAPFAGRISAANVKVGNFVRPADTAPLAVINQMAPVYVTFAIPQRVLVDLRDAMATGGSRVIATIPGHQRSEDGKVAMVGKSTFGSADTGSSRKPNTPKAMIEAVISVVMTGRRIQSSERVIAQAPALGARGATNVPSESSNCPSMTTSSPPDNPEAITEVPCEVRLTLTGWTWALPSCTTNT